MGCSASSTAEAEVSCEVSRTPTPFKEPPPRKLYQLKEVNEGPIAEEEGPQEASSQFPLLSGVIANATANASHIKPESRPVSAKSLKGEEPDATKSPCKCSEDSALSISRPSSARSAGISNDKTESIKYFRSKSKQSLRSNSAKSKDSHNSKEKVHVLLVESDQVTDDNKDYCSESSLGYSTGTYTITKENGYSPNNSNNDLTDISNTSLDKLESEDTDDDQHVITSFMNNKNSSKLPDINKGGDHKTHINGELRLMNKENNEKIDAPGQNEKENSQQNSSINNGDEQSASVNDKESIDHLNMSSNSETPLTQNEDPPMDSISNRNVSSAPISIGDLLDDTDSIEDLPCSLAASSSGLVLPRPVTSRRKKDSSGGSSYSVHSNQSSLQMDPLENKDTNMTGEKDYKTTPSSITCVDNVDPAVNDVFTSDNVTDNIALTNEIDLNIEESSSPQSWLGEEGKENAESNICSIDKDKTMTPVQEKDSDINKLSDQNIFPIENQPLNETDRKETIEKEECSNSENGSPDFYKENDEIVENIETTTIIQNSENSNVENNVEQESNDSIIKIQTSKSHVRFDLPQEEDNNIIENNERDNISTNDAISSSTNDINASGNNSNPLNESQVPVSQNTVECYYFTSERESLKSIDNTHSKMVDESSFDENEVNNLNRISLGERICNKPFQPPIDDDPNVFIENSEEGEATHKDNIYSEKIIPSNESVLEVIIHENSQISEVTTEDTLILDKDSNPTSEIKPTENIEIDLKEDIENALIFNQDMGSSISETDISALANVENSSSSLNNITSNETSSNEVQNESMNDQIFIEGETVNFAVTKESFSNELCNDTITSDITQNEMSIEKATGENILQQELVEGTESQSQSETRNLDNFENSDNVTDTFSPNETNILEKRHEMPEVVSHENSILEFRMENNIIDKSNTNNTDIVNESTDENQAEISENLPTENETEGASFNDNLENEVVPEDDPLSNEDRVNDIFNEDDFEVVPDDNCDYEIQEPDDIIHYVPNDHDSIDLYPKKLETNNIEGYKNKINLSKNNSAKTSPKGSETSSLKSIEIQHVGKFIASNSNSSLLENDSDKDTNSSKQILVGF